MEWSTFFREKPCAGGWRYFSERMIEGGLELACRDADLIDAMWGAEFSHHPGLLETLHEFQPFVGWLIARNPSTPDVVIKRMIDAGEHLAIIADREILPRRFALRLVSAPVSPDADYARVTLARRADLPRVVYVKLADTANVGVLRALAHNPALPPELLQWLASEQTVDEMIALYARHALSLISQAQGVKGFRSIAPDKSNAPTWIVLSNGAVIGARLSIGGNECGYQYIERVDDPVAYMEDVAQRLSVMWEPMTSEEALSVVRRADVFGTVKMFD